MSLDDFAANPFTLSRPLFAKVGLWLLQFRISVCIQTLFFAGLFECLDLLVAFHAHSSVRYIVGPPLQIVQQCVLYANGRYRGFTASTLEAGGFQKRQDLLLIGEDTQPP